MTKFPHQGRKRFSTELLYRSKKLTYLLPWKLGRTLRILLFLRVSAKKGSYWRCHCLESPVTWTQHHNTCSPPRQVKTWLLWLPPVKSHFRIEMRPSGKCETQRNLYWYAVNKKSHTSDTTWQITIMLHYFLSLDIPVFSRILSIALKNWLQSCLIEAFW